MRSCFDLPYCVAMPAVAGDGSDMSSHVGAMSSVASSATHRPTTRSDVRDAHNAQDTIGTTPIPVVLDTNVWIDILVYNDPASRPIRAALESGRLAAIIDTACLYELDRVLDYPQFARFSIDKAAALATTHALTRQLTPPTDAAGAPGADEPVLSADNLSSMPTPTTTASTPTPTLPRCSDRDDQKFLELAAAGRVHWLVTKDKALLKLAKRFARDFHCRIDRPAAFVSVALPEAVSEALTEAPPAVPTGVLPAALPD